MGGERGRVKKRLTAVLDTDRFDFVHVALLSFIIISERFIRGCKSLQARASVTHIKMRIMSHIFRSDIAHCERERERESAAVNVRSHKRSVVYFILFFSLYLT